ncbi:MAG TPA: cyclopropane-fatty-acyl-phospholipid synthase family protein [Thermohalobaculum sp.]|nr:cyclopropane-fatty-acyl-phospholipid synthase family protein [Thermohalobaculum sp.]
MAESARSSVSRISGYRGPEGPAAPGDPVARGSATLTSAAGQPDLPRWFETVFAILKRLEVGAVEIALPDGRVFAAAGSRPGPKGRIDVAEPGFFARMVRQGELGLAEMYMDGWWSTPDLQSVLDVLLLNNERVGRSFPGAGLARAYERLRHWLNANTRRGARRNVAYHYDLGNDFYRLWLDETMTYSSALFARAGEPLREAQTRKYASICDLIGVAPGDHLLEIGCGWGGFAEYAIRERGARVTGLTLSREQRDYALKRLHEAGLAERAEIALRDYRDERGAYDGIASIEMLEAVGEKYWPIFFAAVRDRLNPGRIAALQSITIADRLFPAYRHGTDFIQKYIFPGGMLPPAAGLRLEAAAAGLEIIRSVEFGESYSRTLRAWRGAFNAGWSEIAELGFDQRFCRTWNFYLAVCAACFNAGTTDVTQLALRRG